MIEMMDILPISAWSEVERDIYERFMVNAHVYNVKGAPFTGFVTWGNRLCPVLRKNKAVATSICAVVNQVLRVEVLKTGASSVTDCDAGLMVVCVPVFVRGEFVGMVGCCGGFRAGAEAETYLIEKASGLSEDEITELCSDMNEFTEEESQAIARYIEDRVASIVKEYEAR